MSRSWKENRSIFMMSKVLSAAVLAAVCGGMVACNETPVQPVAVAPVSDPGSYRAIPQPKPLAPVEGYAPGGAQLGAGGATGAPSGGLTISPNPSIQNEDAFVAIYAKHNARMMIFVNRTLKGDPIPNAQLQEISRVERTQSATGAVAVTNTNTVTGQGSRRRRGLGVPVPAPTTSIVIPPAVSPPAGRRSTRPAPR